MLIQQIVKINVSWIQIVPENTNDSGICFLNDENRAFFTLKQMRQTFHAVEKSYGQKSITAITE